MKIHLYMVPAMNLLILFSDRSQKSQKDLNSTQFE